jgi:hypothetical protein
VLINVKIDRDGFFSHLSSVLSHRFPVSERQFINIFLLAGFEPISSYISK